MEKLNEFKTEELIEELCRRDLFKELSEEKREFLIKNGVKQWTNTQFIMSTKKKVVMHYSLKYFKNTPIESIKASIGALKNRCN